MKRSLRYFGFLGFLGLLGLVSGNPGFTAYLTSLVFGLCQAEIKKMMNFFNLIQLGRDLMPLLLHL